jgi:hypothetical protein
MTDIKRLVLAASIAAAGWAGQAPAHAGIVNCTTSNITLTDIRIPGEVGCLLVSAGDCTSYYDPLFSPFPQQVEPQTLNYASCLAF